MCTWLLVENPKCSYYGGTANQQMVGVAEPALCCAFGYQGRLPFGAIDGSPTVIDRSCDIPREARWRSRSVEANRWHKCSAYNRHNSIKPPTWYQFAEACHWYAFATFHSADRHGTRFKIRSMCVLVIVTKTKNNG